MNQRLTIRAGILLLLFFVAFVSLYSISGENREGILKIVFLNVGQGDAIFIDAPSGRQMLIDGGPGKAVLRELSAVMPFFDRSIDAVLATHADQDHVGGLPDVLSRYKVDYFIETGNPGPSSSYEELQLQVARGERQGKIQKVFARKKMAVDLGGGVILRILFPDRDPTGMDTNMSSIVAKLIHGENEFLLTGDSPTQIEDYLISLEDVLLGSDVLKAGHHGSKTSTSPEFVAAVSPQYVVISAGSNNRYGHPHAEVLEILRKANVKILRTDRDGRTIFKSDGVNLKVK